MTETPAFNFPAKDFPMTIEFLSTATSELLHTMVIDGPGVAKIPGQEFFKQPVDVRITTATGETWEG